MALSKAKGTILPISIWLLLQDENRFCYIKSPPVSPLQMFNCPPLGHVQGSTRPFLLLQCYSTFSPLL